MSYYKNMIVTLLKFCPAGYDVQSASTRNGVLYITGAPRYNHTGRVVIYRMVEGNISVSQILKGDQVIMWKSANLCTLVLNAHLKVFL